MDKDRIIYEIQRTANANDGVVLGWRRFEEETGIRYHDWYGQYGPVGVMLYARPGSSRTGWSRHMTKHSC